MTFEFICSLIALVLAPIGSGLILKGHWELHQLDKREAEDRHG